MSHGTTTGTGASAITTILLTGASAGACLTIIRAGAILITDIPGGDITTITTLHTIMTIITDTLIIMDTTTDTTDITDATADSITSMPTTITTPDRTTAFLIHTVTVTAHRVLTVPEHTDIAPTAALIVQHRRRADALTDRTQAAADAQAATIRAIQATTAL